MSAHEFASAGYTSGQLNAIVKKMRQQVGSDDAPERFLRDELVVEKPGQLRGEVLQITLKGGDVIHLKWLGKYGSSDSDITIERFPLLQHDPVNRVVELVKLGYDPTSQEVLAEFGRRGLERPTYEDAFYFGIAYPEEQRTRSLAFIHEPVLCPHNRHDVLVLYEHNGERVIGLRPFYDRWYRGYVFVGVHKSK